MFSKPYLKIVLIISSTFTLFSCSSPEVTVRIASGSNRSAYQRLSEQIKISVEAIDDVKVKDNFDTEGSRQNLQLLLDKKVDFAIVQLDVASEAMKKNKVQSIANLTQEYIHLVTREDSKIKRLNDLNGKKISTVSPKSGGYLTAQRLFQATNLNIKKDIAEGDIWKKLTNKEVDAVFYVGPLGTNKRIREQLAKGPRLRLIPMDEPLINYLTIQFPESYKEATIPIGTYRAIPPLPQTDLPTISTAGVLVTRPDVDKKKVSLITWAIISSAHQYSSFYPQLAEGSPEKWLSQGLIYLHPGARNVYKNGDPRDAWLRYLRENKPLQAASIMLLSTTILGYTIRKLRKRKTSKILKANRESVNVLRPLLTENPQKASESIEALRQNYRQMFTQGAISAEIYQQVEQMNVSFLEDCRLQQQKISQEFLREQVNLLAQAREKMNFYLPVGLEHLSEAEKNYQSLLFSGHIDIKIYLQLKQINLLKIIFYSLQSKID